MHVHFAVEIQLNCYPTERHDFTGVTSAVVELTEQANDSIFHEKLKAFDLFAKGK